jgi:hypothetical protein
MRFIVAGLMSQRFIHGLVLDDKMASMGPPLPPNVASVASMVGLHGWWVDEDAKEVKAPNLTITASCSNDWFSKGLSGTYVALGSLSGHIVYERTELGGTEKPWFMYFDQKWKFYYGFTNEEKNKIKENTVFAAAYNGDLSEGRIHPMYTCQFDIESEKPPSSLSITTSCPSSWDNSVLSGNFIQGISAGGRTMYKKLELDANGNPWCIMQDGSKGNHRWVYRYGFDVPGHYDGCPKMYYWDEVDNTDAAVFDPFTDKISNKEDCGPIKITSDCEWSILNDAYLPGWTSLGDIYDNFEDAAYDNFADAVAACLSLSKSDCGGVTYSPYNKIYQPRRSSTPTISPHGEVSYVRKPNCN